MDGTLDVEGRTLDVEAGSLAGKNVTPVTYGPQRSISSVPQRARSGRRPMPVRRPQSGTPSAKLSA